MNTASSQESGNLQSKTLSEKTTLSIVIPSYGRDTVLCDTIRSLLKLEFRADELLLLDQTPMHDPITTARLSQWQANGLVRRIRLDQPSIPSAMNRGALEARSDIVLFLDDDIVPDDNLIRGHLAAYQKHPEAWAVAGKVIQGEKLKR